MGKKWKVFQYFNISVSRTDTQLVSCLNGDTSSTVPGMSAWSNVLTSSDIDAFVAAIAEEEAATVAAYTTLLSVYPSCYYYLPECLLPSSFTLTFLRSFIFLPVKNRLNCSRFYRSNILAFVNSAGGPCCKGGTPCQCPSEAKTVGGPGGPPGGPG